MRFATLVFCTIVATFLAISACLDVKEKPVIDLGAIDASKESDAVKAERYAQAGELIVLGPNFMDAQKLMDKALAYDPQNTRAGFWTTMLTVQMLNKGIFARLEPLIQTFDKEDQEKFNDLKSRYTKDLKDSSFTKFVMDGAGDIRSEEEFENHILYVHLAFLNMESLLKKLRETKMTMKSYIMNQGMDEGIGDCKAVIENDVLTPYTCPKAKLQQWDLDYADWEALRLYAMVEDYHYTGAAAYDLTGAYESHLALKKAKTEKAQILALKTNRRLGQLINPEMLKEINQAGLESIEVMKMAMANEDSFCKSGSFDTNNRPGHLIYVGFCVDGETRGVVNFVEKALKGPTKVAIKTYSSYGGFRWQSGKLRTVFNFQKLLDGSITNLQSLLPTYFDEKENATKIPDETIGGLLPKGDGVKVIHTQYIEEDKKLFPFLKEK